MNDSYGNKFKGKKNIKKIEKQLNYQYLGDEFLILWFKENYLNFEFIKKPIPYERFERKQNIIRCVESLNSKQELHKQRGVLQDLWAHLISCAIIYLKSEDKREIYHDDGDYGLDLMKEYFNKFCDFEKLLYGNSRYYRDHLSHLFNVFFLGEFVLREYLGGFKFLNFRDKELLGKYSIKPEEKEAIWCLIALTHDLGYPLEVVQSINSQVKDMIQLFNMDSISFVLSQQSQMLNENVISLISSELEKLKKDKYLTHVQSKYLWKYLKALENYKHGIVSCILLFKSLFYFLESDFSIDSLRPMNQNDARQFLIRQKILRAIASHDCDFIYHLKLLDISTFLRIIDEMQEWNRPTLMTLFETQPKIDVHLKEFSKNKISYSIIFSLLHNNEIFDMEIKNISQSIHTYFATKTKKYLEILRSAIGGDLRDFLIEFEVIDRVKKNKEHTYKLIHKNPEDIIIIEDGRRINFDKLSTKLGTMENNFTFR